MRNGYGGLNWPDQPFITREETSKYKEQNKVGKIRQFSFDMDARSFITFPAYPVQVQKGWIEIRGLAWSGRGRIVKAEISTDAERIWLPAKLQEPVLDKGIPTPGIYGTGMEMQLKL